MRKYLLIATGDNEMKICLDATADESMNGIWKQNFRGYFVCLFGLYGIYTSNAKFIFIQIDSSIWNNSV